MTSFFNDKVVLVTGGASGIGRATALAFAAQGAKVMVADVDVTGGEETCQLISTRNGQAQFVQTDVSQNAQVEAMLQSTLAAYGKLDIACNNAGIEGQMVPTADYEEAMFRKVIDINLTGVWLCMKYEIPAILAQGGGAIVNVSSVAGVIGAATASAYTAAKHGVIGLTRSAALEYAAAGLRINAICPAYIETPMVMERHMNAGHDEKIYRRFSKAHPIGRMGKPEEVADGILWLASPQSSFVTGHALVLDGGMTIQ